MTEKIVKIHKLISVPNYHCDSLLLNPSYHMTNSFKNHLFHYAMFMNINKNVENQGKMRKKTIAIARFWMGYKIYLASLGHIPMAASVVRGTTLMSLNIENIVLNIEHICIM